MSAITSKVKLLPVSKDSEFSYLYDRAMEVVAPIVLLMDEFGENYDHENPWKEDYLENPKFWLYRVTIGAVGRINTCADAVTFGLRSSTPAKGRHFTSTALYYVYRIARQVRREYEYLRDLDKWINTLLEERNPNSRYLEYNGYEEAD